MEEKPFGLLKTKNHHLFLKAGGLGGAQGMFLGQEHCKHLLWATARTRDGVSCPMALTCWPEMEPEIRSFLGTQHTTSSPKECCHLLHPEACSPCVSTQRSFLLFLD